MNRKQADLINRLAQGFGQAVNTATSAASEGVRQDIPELVRNAARGFAEGSGPLMDKVPMMVGDSMRQGVEGFVQGWKPGLQDLRAGIGPAAQSAWEGAKSLAANRKVQGGAAAALALYGGKKVYDAYQEHKLRRLAGDFMEHEHPGFAGAHDLGALMAANRIGQFSGKTASFGSAAALGVVGVPIGAIGGVVDPVGVWRDSVFRMRHPRKKLTPAELRAGRAGMGLGAAATQAALLYGAYRGGKALYNHFRPEEEGGEEAPVKEAGWGTTAASGVAGAAVGVPLGAVLGALEPVQTWRDIYAGSGVVGHVLQDVHPDVRPGMSQGLRAGLGLGAAATQAALLYGAYRGGKALYNHFRPEEEGGEEAPVKEAGWGTTAASGVAGAAVGVPVGAVLGALEPVQTWRDIYAGSGIAAPAPQDVHPDVRPGMSQGLRAGLGLGAAATQAALLYGAYRGGKALYNHFRPEEEGGEEAPVKEAGAWDTVKQFAKGHTMSNSPLAAGLHAGLVKGTMGGAFTGGYTALKGRQEGRTGEISRAVRPSAGPRAPWAGRS